MTKALSAYTDISGDAHSAGRLQRRAHPSPAGPTLQAVPVEQVGEASSPNIPAPPLCAAAAPKPPACLVAATIGDDCRVMPRIEHGLGALRAVLGSRHDDETGDKPAAFAAQAIQDLFNLVLGGKKLAPGSLDAADGTALNALIQAVAAFSPTDELEGMIAIQAAALHFVTMDCLGRAMRSERPEFRQQHLSMSNKCARTFAALVETLNRNRGKTTTQRVIVENVNVSAGGQAVVGAVVGVGSRQNGAVQTHGQSDTEGHAHHGGGACCAALPGPQSGGQSVSAAGDEGQEALPHARGRGRNRRAEGKPKSAGSRLLQRRGNPGAPNTPRAAAGRARAERVNGLSRSE